MNLDDLTDHEIALTARAMSIHRASLRRKLDRLTPGTSEHAQTLAEIEDTQCVVDKFNSADMRRIGT